MSQFKSLAEYENFIYTLLYEVCDSKGKLFWYDSQPHPANSELACTHPHHKHIPSNIKHHRIPAPDMSFTHPNLTFLLHEIKTAFLK